MNSRTLQNELQASFVETQSLIKEMEMLNLMFAELEHVSSFTSMILLIMAVSVKLILIKKMGIINALL